MRLLLLNITAGGISGGYKNYLDNLLPIITKNKNISELFIVIPKIISFQHLKQCITSDIDFNKEKFVFIQYKRLRQIKSIITKISPDIIYIPTARYIKIRNIPIVSAVQNMWPLAWNNKNYPLIEKLKYIALKKITKSAINKSDHIIAPSNFVYSYLIDKMHISKDKISQVYFGCMNIKNCVKPSIISKDIMKKFIFSTGSIEPYRGLEDLLYAMSNQSLKQTDNIYLVIAGHLRKTMTNYYKKLEKMARQINPNIIWLFNLKKEEMSWCYKNCAVFVMTSRVEACPNIVLEAMANGCLCISTDNPPMPEFFKDSALYYKAGDHQTLSMHISDILNWSDDKKSEYKNRALLRSRDFSWDICAEQTVNVFENVIKKYKHKQ